MIRLTIFILSVLLWVHAAAQNPKAGFARHSLPELGYIDLPLRFQPASAQARKAIDAPAPEATPAPEAETQGAEDFLFVTERLNSGMQREPDTYVIFRIETAEEDPGSVYRLHDSISFTDEEMMQFDAACREAIESLIATAGAKMISWSGLQILSAGRVRYECIYQVPGEVEFQLISILRFNYDRTHTLTLSGPRSAIARDATALEEALDSFTITHER